MEKLRPAIKAMKDLSIEVTIEMERLKPSVHLPELCKMHKELHEALEIIEDLVKGLKALEEELSQETLPDLFEALKVDSIKAHSRTFVLGVTPYFNLAQNEYEQGLPWLREQGYGGIIKEGVNQQSLTSAMKAYTEEHGMFPPEFIKRHFKRKISIRKK